MLTCGFCDEQIMVGEKYYETDCYTYCKRCVDDMDKTELFEMCGGQLKTARENDM